MTSSSLCLAIALASFTPASTASAASGASGEPGGNSAEHRNNEHDLKHPLGATQKGLRQQALQERLQGKGSGRVHQVASGQYVELQQTRNDRVFVILAEVINVNTQDNFMEVHVRPAK